MRAFQHALKNKISNRRGMSLGEVMVAILLLTLATMTLVSTVSLAIRQYNNSVRSSEAQSLASTLRTVMENELTYTTEVHADAEGNVTSFLSPNYNINGGAATTFLTSNASAYEKLYIGSSTAAVKLLGDGSYPRNLGVKITSFIYDDETYYFTVGMEVGAGTSSYYSGTFQVKNVNETKAIMSQGGSVVSIDYTNPQSVGKYVFSEVFREINEVKNGTLIDANYSKIVNGKTDQNYTKTMTLPNGKEITVCVYNRSYQSFDDAKSRMKKDTASFIYDRTTGELSTIIYYDGEKFSQWTNSGDSSKNWENDEAWSDTYTLKNGTTYKLK